MSDYYEILGVQKGASDDEIKKAYRKLALKYHPDRNRGDKSSEETFKKISEAYAVLSDPEKRQQFDTFGSSGFHQRYSADDIFRGTDFNSILKDFNMGFNGGSGFEQIFSQMFGGGARRTSPEKGQNVEYTVQITFHESFTGSEKPIHFRLNDGTVRDLKVKIPAGIKEGGKLRVSGKGAPSPYGGRAGDLIVVVNIAPDSFFRREGQDLEADLEMKISEAILGASVDLKTMTGNKRIKVPPGVKPGTKIRLRGLGFPSPQKNGDSGDLFAVVKIGVPKGLSAEQQKAVLALQASGL